MQTIAVRDSVHPKVSGTSPAVLVISAGLDQLLITGYPKTDVAGKAHSVTVQAVDATVDLIPERRIAQIESAWIADNKVNAGSDVTVKVFLRQFRGERIEREVKVNIPAGMPRGEHRILFSDAESLNRFQSIAGSLNNFVDVRQTVTMLNQERSNNKLYVSLVESSPTAYLDDKTLPSLPSSVLNVMQSGRAANRAVVTSPETATEQMALPFDSVVTGSYSLRIHVN